MSLLNQLKSRAVRRSQQWLESVRDKPIFSQDRILRAYSEDGIYWVKDLKFRYEAPLSSPHMDYYVSRDSKQNLWFRSSVFNEKTGRWYTLLSSSQGKMHFENASFENLFSPCWWEDKLMGVASYANGERKIVVLGTDQTISSITLQNSQELGLIEDIALLETDSRWVIFGAVRSSDRCEIHQWENRKSDAKEWHYVGLVLDQNQSGLGEVINNPFACCVEKDWFLYFRSGNKNAIGNSIFLARSQEGKNWEVLPEPILKPGGKWDTHGVGFPFVFKEQKKWTMYYTGYWGNCESGHRTRQKWLEV